jgi:hypothetical protein
LTLRPNGDHVGKGAELERIVSEAARSIADDVAGVAVCLPAEQAARHGFATRGILYV